MVNKPTYTVPLKQLVPPLGLRRPFNVNTSNGKRNFLVIAGDQAMFLIDVDGYYLIASLSANVKFSAPAFLDDDLYVLDGPVLLKYDMTSFSAQKPTPLDPELALNILTGVLFVAGQGQSWQQALSDIYPSAGTAFPTYAAVLALEPPDPTQPAIFMLGDDGSVHAVDTSLSLRLVSKRYVPPDALEWQIYTDTSGSYLCYSNLYQVISINTATIVVESVPALSSVVNALVWLRMNMLANNNGSSTTFTATNIVGYVDRFVCHTDVTNAQSPVITTFDCTYDDGGAALPVLGQAMGMVNVAPRVKGVILTPNGSLLAPPLATSDGEKGTCYLAIDDPAEGPCLQMWEMPLVYNNELATRWMDLFNLMPPFSNSGFMQAKYNPSSSQPAPQFDVLVTSALAIACMQRGVQCVPAYEFH